ncbi:Alanine--tRNA ligase [Rhodobacteraceae bacterium THAF1]|uniref:alanyl-tRNA editing protein n=1 Tax=Palleronia sp. THAF1 TaxID=2587842 RepID=UPI000F3B1DB1|nr:alanyl-tRNA editing protein [Palleronia sp. THAF1]QFU09167.1 Alanine--tRNA ligase [Palleronia sp. THAF1]VDC27242.1 Alanine--tRNA ligase [Rhodobacteraceae bacterium THAF1]
MTEPLFLADAYARDAEGVVASVEDGVVVLDRSLFYATGGGQPGDSGRLEWDGGFFTVTEAVKGDGGAIRLMGNGELPTVGVEVRQVLDWDRRWGHMRVHTALHLLSVVIPLPVSGGQIAEAKGRLDFDMPDAPEDKQALQDALNDLVTRDLPVTTDWIDETELDANPGLVKTMSVQPPRGAGRVRLVRIGQGEAQVDLQPCGGTHVARTGEIGPLRIGKVEKKGARNRRVYVHLD